MTRISTKITIEPTAGLDFCNFNGVERLPVGWSRKFTGRGFGANGGMLGAGENEVLQLPQLFNCINKAQFVFIPICVKSDANWYEGDAHGNRCKKSVDKRQ